MPLINSEQLQEILSDLGPDFALSDEQRTVLCDDINGTFNAHQKFCQMRSDATPHKRMARLQQIERTTQKLQELLDGADFDLEWEIDRVRGLPKAQQLLDVPDGIFMSPQESAVLMALVRNDEFPSKQAVAGFHRIKQSLSLLVALAQSGISYDRKRKDGKRKYDVFRKCLIEALERIYERTFKKEASARREGNWPTFLSRVLSILEGKETTPDAAYEALLKVNERLRLREQFLTSKKVRQTPLSAAP